MAARGPRSVGGSPVSMMLYVDDVDAIAKRAIAAGAKLTRPIADQFYGDRSGGLEDPFGHHWHIATHIEDVSPEELQRRSAALFHREREFRGGHRKCQSACCGRRGGGRVEELDEFNNLAIAKSEDVGLWETGPFCR